MPPRRESARDIDARKANDHASVMPAAVRNSPMARSPAMYYTAGLQRHLGKDDTVYRKILIMGLPGAGKTTLAAGLAPRLNAVHFNADEVRRNVNKDLGFSEADRVEHARRMGWLCDQVVKTGCFAVADFICPTPQTRAAFTKDGDAFIVWMDRVKESSFEDTNRMFVPPERVDLRILGEGTVEYWVEQIATQIRPVFAPKRPTALFVG